MVAARYEVVQTDARSGAIVGDPLPVVNGLSYGEALNDAGSASVTVPMLAADPDTLVCGVSGIAILRDSLPVWGGIVWTADADLEAGTLALGAGGYHSYYRGRKLEDGYQSTVDQAAHLRAWFSYANGTNGIATDTALVANTGRVRERLWTQYELKPIAEAIEELAEDADGFNFRYVPYVSGNSIRHRVLISNRGGNPLPFALTHTVNCDITRVSYDSSAMCTRAYAVGADTGNGARLVGVQENADLATLMAARERVVTWSDVKTTETLLDKAAAMILAGAEPVAIPSLTLYPGEFSPTDFVPGDSGAVQADYGYVRLLADYVLTERATSVDTNGTEITTLSLANKGLFDGNAD